MNGIIYFGIALLCMQSKCVLGNSKKPIYFPSPNNGCKDDKGIDRAHGSTWIDPERPCIHNICNNGKISSPLQDCAPPPCKNYVKVPGKCCPQCPASGECKDENGVTRENGANWSDPDNPCFRYSCLGGQISTAVIRCARPNCENPINVPGVCCLQCPDVPVGGCTDENGTPRENGASWTNPDSPCFHYSCSDGKIFTAIQDCARPLCENPISDPGVCCPRCPDGLDGGCTDENGTPRENGASWSNPKRPCYHYSCSNGEIFTAIRDCARPPCDKPISVPGVCCPRCPDVVDGSCTDENGTPRENGASWSNPNRPCYHYSCSNGKIFTAVQDCARPPCSKPITVPGKCCPICQGLYQVP